jgi:hypothetical protein
VVRWANIRFLNIEDEIHERFGVVLISDSQECVGLDT